MKEWLKRTLLDVLVLLIVLSYIFSVYMAIDYYQFRKALDLNMALQQQRLQQQQTQQRVMPQIQPKAEKAESNEKK